MVVVGEVVVDYLVVGQKSIHRVGSWWLTVGASSDVSTIVGNSCFHVCFLGFKSYFHVIHKCLWHVK